MIAIKYLQGKKSILHSALLLCTMLILCQTCKPAKQPVGKEERAKVEVVAAQFMQLMKDRNIEEAMSIGNEQVLRQFALLDVMDIEKFTILDIVKDDFGIEVFVEINSETKTILYFRKKQDQWKIINAKSNRELSPSVRIDA